MDTLGFLLESWRVESGDSGKERRDFATACVASTGRHLNHRLSILAPGKTRMVRRSQKPKALNREEASWQEVPSGSKGNGVSGPVPPGFEEKKGVWGWGGE